MGGVRRYQDPGHGCTHMRCTSARNKSAGVQHVGSVRCARFKNCLSHFHFASITEQFYVIGKRLDKFVWDQHVVATLANG